MSNAKHIHAILDGLNGPFFPAPLSGIHALYATSGYFTTGSTMHDLGKRLPGYQVGHRRVQTVDNYNWPFTVTFHVGEALIVVCFPGTEDLNLMDGTQTDRHCAIHVKGQLSRGAISDFAERLLTEMFIFVQEQKARHVMYYVLNECFEASEPEKNASLVLRGQFNRRFRQEVVPEVRMNTTNDRTFSATLEMTINGRKVRIENKYWEPHV